MPIVDRLQANPKLSSQTFLRSPRAFTSAGDFNAISFQSGHQTPKIPKLCALHTTMVGNLVFLGGFYLIALAARFGPFDARKLQKVRTLPSRKYHRRLPCDLSRCASSFVAQLQAKRRRSSNQVFARTHAPHPFGCGFPPSLKLWRTSRRAVPCGKSDSLRPCSFLCVLEPRTPVTFGVDGRRLLWDGRTVSASTTK